MNDLTDTYWYRDKLWAGWATQLEGSDVWFVTQPEYDLLCLITDLQPLYLDANCGGANLRVLGVANPLLINGVMWKQELHSINAISEWATLVGKGMQLTQGLGLRPSIDRNRIPVNTESWFRN